MRGQPTSTNRGYSVQAAIEIYCGCQLHFTTAAPASLKPIEVLSAAVIHAQESGHTLTLQGTVKLNDLERRRRREDRLGDRAATRYARRKKKEAALAES